MFIYLSLTIMSSHSFHLCENQTIFNNLRIRVQFYNVIDIILFHRKMSYVTPFQYVIFYEMIVKFKCISIHAFQCTKIHPCNHHSPIIRVVIITCLRIVAETSDAIVTKV